MYVYQKKRRDKDKNAFSLYEIYYYLYYYLTDRLYAHDILHVKIIAF